MTDYISIASYTCTCLTTAGESSVFDKILSIAMAIIAIANIIMTVYLFCQSRKDTSEGEMKRRKFELIQSLILNHRLQLLYDFYDNVSNECLSLLKSSDRVSKKAVDDNNKALLKRFRLDFVMLFNVVDHQLYEDIKSLGDNLIDGITEAIFDEGINLTHEPKYNEMITEPLSRNRNAMISKLYELANMDGRSKKS